MTKAERAAAIRARAMSVCRRKYKRNITSVAFSYKTRKGDPVGVATMECGHTLLVDMTKKAVWRICWQCHRADTRTIGDTK